MVAKDPRSTYRPGPTRAWVKVKQRRSGVFVVAGMVTRGERFAVLVGQRQGRALAYLGTVEMGYNRASVSELMARGTARAAAIAVRGPAESPRRDVADAETARPR